MADEPGADLLTRFVQGDHDAFETIFTQFEGEVHRWILRIVRDRSATDDILIEAFWRAYRGRARFDPSRSFGAWMRRIATNVARDHLQAAQRHAWNTAADDRIPAPVRDERGVHQSVAIAFRRLPPKLQTVATLALIEDQPYAEIADALDVPVGTVKSRVFRAIRLLRKELARLGIRP